MRCPHCGHSFQDNSKWYPHKMDYSKVKVLKMIANVNKNHEWAKIQQDSALIKDDERDFTVQTDAVHASRLAWFGLIDKKSKREGLVKINSNGINFLKGTFLVPSKIWVKKGVVKKIEHPLVSVKSVRNVVLDKNYWDSYPGVEI